MFVKVAADGGVTLEDRNNFRAFKLVIEGSPAGLDAARAVLAGTAEMPDQGYAWISETALRQRPEVAQDPAWQGHLGTMIEKARPHGWVDDARKAIRAHVEWTDPA
jgi:hypothetical protein